MIIHKHANSSIWVLEQLDLSQAYNWTGMYYDVFIMQNLYLWSQSATAISSVSWSKNIKLHKLGKPPVWYLNRAVIFHIGVTA